MRKHSHLPTLTERLAIMANIDAAELAMLPGGVAEDMAAATAARIRQAEYVARSLAEKPKNQTADYLLAGFLLSMLAISVATELIK